MVSELSAFSLNVAKRPLYSLFIDAKACFDRVTRQDVIVNAFTIGTDLRALTIINNRLQNRNTILKYNDVLMGKIHDSVGVEQGGLLSDRLFRLVGNNQLVSAKQSNLGVKMIYPNHPEAHTMQPLIISAIGQADDTALFSNNTLHLSILAQLSETYAKNSNTIFVPKTNKYVAFVNKTLSEIPPIEYHIAPITISGKKIPLSQSAEHVGVIRDCRSIFPHLLNRMSAHKKATSLLRFAGSGITHHTNLFARLRAFNVFATPILLSGIPSLIIDKTNSKTLDNFYKTSLKNTLSLPCDIPDPFLFLIAGTLPFNALVSLRQYSLFFQIK